MEWHSTLAKNINKSILRQSSNYKEVHSPNRAKQPSDNYTDIYKYDGELQEKSK